MTKRTSYELIGIDAHGNEHECIVPDCPSWRAATQRAMRLFPRCNRFYTKDRHRHIDRPGVPRVPAIGSLAIADAMDAARREKVAARIKRPRHSAASEDDPRRAELESLFREPASTRRTASPDAPPPQAEVTIRSDELGEVLRNSVLPQLEKRFKVEQVAAKLPPRYAHLAGERVFSNSFSYLRRKGVIAPVPGQRGFYDQNHEVRQSQDESQASAVQPAVPAPGTSAAPSVGTPIAAAVESEKGALTIAQKAQTLMLMAGALLTADDDRGRKLNDISDRVLAGCEQITSALADLQGLMAELRKLPELTVHIAQRLEFPTANGRDGPAHIEARG